MSLEAWCVAFEDLEGRRIGYDIVCGHQVSTVWLGTDHGFYKGAPIIFETMVFRGSESAAALESNRYCTELEAKLGHIEMCELVRTKYGMATVATEPSPQEPVPALPASCQTAGAKLGK